MTRYTPVLYLRSIHSQERLYQLTHVQGSLCFVLQIIKFNPCVLVALHLCSV